MFQQNKTDQLVIDANLSKQNEQHQFELQHNQSQNQVQFQSQQNDQSKIQIVIPVRKSHDGLDQQISPMRIVDSQNQNEQPQPPLKQLNQSLHKPNANDVSAVCIELFSQNETIERKYTLKSLHYSRVVAELRKEDKVFIQQGIQTSTQFISDKPVQPIIDENKNLKQNKSSQNNQIESSSLKVYPKPAQQIQKVYSSRIARFPQSQSQKPQFIITNSQNAEEPKIAIKQTILNSSNNQASQVDLQIKQTAYINFLQTSLPQIRNRIVSFQNLQTNHEQNISRPQIKSIQTKEDQETMRFLEGIDQNEYDSIISQLTQKMVFLQRQYNEIVSQNNQNQIFQEVKQLQINPQNHQEDHTQIKVQGQLFIKKLSINKSYDVSIPFNQQQQRASQKLKKSEQNQYDYPSSSKQVQMSNRNSPKYNQFSSGDVTNLLAQSQSQLIDLRDLQNPQNSPTNLNQLSQIPVVFLSSLSPQNSVQSVSSSQLPVIVISQSNLATVKESYEELPYERFKSIMGLELIVSKISFKEKHYPSSYSTQKQLKLYGKRLLRLLFQHYNNTSNQLEQVNVLTLQNDLEFYKSQQHVVYYLKKNQNFVFVCYFNHTIYIGEYITQGPIKQIIRQGYGIQLRQSKYLYQGQFFADKKHGYGYIQFVGKNPFIYCGYFLDGFMDGHGKSMNSNGQIYLGDYKLGQRDGLGKLIYNQNKNAFYQGQFYDGFKHGKGFQIFDNGDSYQGSYVKDKFEGQGQYKWKNSTIYQGTFVQGFKHGPGLLIFTNGQTFEKYYDHNKEINLEDDKKTIKSSRISAYSQNKLQQKTLIQEKTRNLRNTRSVSGQSLLSYKSKSNEKSTKLIKDKNKIAQLLKQKEIQDDLRNLDKILKDPTDEAKIKKIFSVKKLDTRDKIIGKMYNTTERPAMKISEKGQLDLIKLSKIGSQRKSLVNFDSDEKLQELRESSHQRRVQRTTNFSQF